jgi:SAM-dependent methyltransferase
MLLRDLALLGPQKTFRFYANKIRKRMHGSDSPSVDQSLDSRFGVDTGTSTMPEDLRIQGATQKWGVHYSPTNEELFRHMLQFLRIDFTKYIFVDLGSGKGAILLMASEYPFRKVIGVEYSKSLAAIAIDNIRRYENPTLKCGDITCVCADASGFDFAAEPAVLYLFNPFQGKVMDRVIKNIENSLQHHPRDLWIIYHVPWEHRKFNRSRKLRTVESNLKFCIYRSVV